MARTRTVWRKIGTALSALVLTLLVLGPSIDALVCNDGFAPAAAAAEVPTVDAIADRQAPPADLDGCVPSIHCHCYHASPFVPETPLAVAVIGAGRGSQAPDRESPTAVNRQFQLIRPPRA